uniref:Putative actin-related protein arp2/3 complex subunit arp2 n=1 Tax=Ixodes ricinus TaxID=34613 RepID=A0A0K8RDI5_IXORI
MFIPSCAQYRSPSGTPPPASSAASTPRRPPSRPAGEVALHVRPAPSKMPRPDISKTEFVCHSQLSRPIGDAPALIEMDIIWTGDTDPQHEARYATP